MAIVLTRDDSVVMSIFSNPKVSGHAQITILHRILRYGRFAVFLNSLADRPREA